MTNKHEHPARERVDVRDLVGKVAAMAIHGPAQTREEVDRLRDAVFALGAERDAAESALAASRAERDALAVGIGRSVGGGFAHPGERITRSVARLRDEHTAFAMRLAAREEELAASRAEVEWLQEMLVEAATAWSAGVSFDGAFTSSWRESVKKVMARYYTRREGILAALTPEAPDAD